ncbi:hypothetical protein CLAIMM_12090 [Cladophialophora immunda]|nr:hypothetical protein CLAIMM_12090 [Cladophialophora immunda]
MTGSTLEIGEDPGTKSCQDDHPPSRGDTDNHESLEGFVVGLGECGTGDEVSYQYYDEIQSGELELRESLFRPSPSPMRLRFALPAAGVYHLDHIVDDTEDDMKASKADTEDDSDADACSEDDEDVSKNDRGP